MTPSPSSIGTPSGMTADAVNMSDPVEAAAFMDTFTNNTLFQNYATDSYLDVDANATDISFDELYPSNMMYIVSLMVCSNQYIYIYIYTTEGNPIKVYFTVVIS